MLLRVSSFRGLAIFAIVSTITYTIALRWLFPTGSSYATNDQLNPSSSPSFSSPFKPGKSQASSVSSVFPYSPVHDELFEMHHPPLRLSPSELDKPISEREYKSEKLTYNDAAFRQSSTPILWLDEKGDIRWNQAAERHMLSYLTQKQFPNLDQLGNASLNKKLLLDTCLAQSLFVMHQHWSGFFSRVLCFIAQFGQTLYSPRIAALRGSRFSGGRGEADDFLGQGITRYFLPISICSAYEHHPEMGELKNLIESTPESIHIANSHDLHEKGGGQSNRALFSSEFWKMDYHHVPIRKWLFDRNKTSVSYDSSVDILSDHSDEHIYAPKNQNDVPIGDWINTNKPDAFSSDLLPNKGKYKLTWQDYVFGSFLRYMFVLYFGSRNTPRIEYGLRVLTQYWTSYLMNKYGHSTRAKVFEKIAGLYIRRGDKSNEDSFWAKHNRWRNLSLYVKGIVDEEKRQNKTFKYVFVMTDDTSVLNSLRDYVNPESKGKDELYAREHLRGREILSNVLAPQECFDPFRRIGFDQFLVSMRFLIEHSTFTIGHTDSNVFRFFREVVYSQRQHRPDIQSFTYVQNAPDSFETKAETPKV